MTTSIVEQGKLVDASFEVAEMESTTEGWRMKCSIGMSRLPVGRLTIELILMFVEGCGLSVTEYEATEQTGGRQCYQVWGEFTNANQGLDDL